MMRSLLRLIGYGLVCIAGCIPSNAQSPGPHNSLADKIVALEITGRDVDGHDVQAWGTGFLIHKNGWVLTSAHLFDDLEAEQRAVRASFKINAHIGDFSTPGISATLLPDKNRMIWLCYIWNPGMAAILLAN